MTHLGRDREQGVALVLALMIVALIAIVATEISWRFELSMSRSGNRWAGVQARAYLEGAEQLAMVALRADAEGDETKKSDHLGEDWARQAEPFPTDHGWVEGRLVDAHGLFNLNTMRPPSGDCGDGSSYPRDTRNCHPCADYSEQQYIFMRLLQVFNLGDEEEEINLQPDQAKEITDAVIDWLDDDSNIRGFGGAESDYYESLESPVTIANGEMISVSELQVIKGMPSDLYRQLLPHVVALPSREVSIINVSTASAELLRSVKAKTDNGKRCELFAYDEEKGAEFRSFTENGEFRTRKDLEKNVGELPAEWSEANGGKDLIGENKLMDVFQSKYFLFYSTAAIGDDYIRRGASLIKREESKDPKGGLTIEVVRRTDANF